MHPARPVCLLILASLSFLFWGCDGAMSLRNSTSGGTPDFGDAYVIALAPSPELPDEPPAIDNDSLAAGVQYAGGCRDHDFQLHHRLRRDTLEMWIRHDANGDDCEAYIYERIRMPVPDDARRASTILLLDPAGDFPLHVAR